MSNLQLHHSIDVLPPSLQEEVADFVAFLYQRHSILVRPKSSTLSNFIGTIPDLDIVSFEKYLTATRNEWNAAR